MSREGQIREALFEHTLNGHAAEVKKLTEEALSLGMDPLDILFDALIPSLEEVGVRFERGDYFVPEMLIAARAMQGALGVLRPLLAESGTKPVGRYLMGTVKGDIHDIGKNLCTIMLEGGGFEVVDLGVNVPPERFVEAVEEHKPHIVGFSAFLTTTMPMFKVNLDALEKAGIRDEVKVMVGGAPVTADYAEQSGADAYAPDASTCTRIAKQLVGAAETGPGSGALGEAVSQIENTLRSVEE
jgi:corrinoid protein of di/trimethylamine methyltransferase